MSAFAPKNYQGAVLESVEKYFDACHAHEDAAQAFHAVTAALWGQGQAFHALPGFAPDMPYFCLRVPTGGGKTWLAASSVALVNARLLRTEHSVILWLVPSDAIRAQTLKALKGLSHPYHAALKQAGPVAVMDIEEARSVSRATLDTATVVIVATAQAFARQSTEVLKVYASSGALMAHFDGLAPAQRQHLLRDDEGNVPYSLANVLRLRRPFLIVDEAHNARTDMRFETFARFDPSGVMELTATPDTARVPSNVLHSVGAAELKQAQMIKLPVLLETEANWQVCLADAIARRDALQSLADAEQRQGATPLRPLVLIQAQPRRAGVETLDAEAVRSELTNNHRIPPDEIVIATGEERGLEELDAKYSGGIADPACPAKFVITQRALAEGWDCPSAYILVGLSPQQSSTAVEQLLGRILRQPEARHRASPQLNQSYAFVASRDFAQTAKDLRDRLVEGAGFDRQESREFVTAAKPEQKPLDIGSGRVRFTPVVVPLVEKPDLKAVPKDTRDKIEWDAKAKTLTVRAPLSTEDTATLSSVVANDLDRTSVIQAGVESRTTALEHFVTPAEAGERLRVPQLALLVQGQLQLFDDPEALDYPWELSPYDAAPTPEDLDALQANDRVEGGAIDVDSQGQLTVGFIADMQRDLGLAYTPEHWDQTRLAAWLCRNLPEASLTHAGKMAFVSAWLSALLARDGYTLARANQAKFLVRTLLQRTFSRLRRDAVTTAFQQALFPTAGARRVAVDECLVFEFESQAYAPSRDYDATRWGRWEFRKHFYGRIGDFDSQEEFDCAVRLDMLAQQGRIRHWVRNLVRKEGCAFFLQKADGRFWPDFVCELPDGTILVVEYKGEQGWVNAQDDRAIGELWAELSNGRCRFVMVRDRRWEMIDAALAPTRENRI